MSRRSSTSTEALTAASSPAAAADDEDDDAALTSSATDQSTPLLLLPTPTPTSASTVNSSPWPSMQTTPHTVPSGSGRRLIKPNSIYVPHNRISRYMSALSSLALVRFNRAVGSELPLDKIGLLSSVSFGWLSEYLSAGHRGLMRDKCLPSLSRPESCDINGPRLEGLLQAQFVKRGQAGASMAHVIWTFARTRLLVSALLHLCGSLLSLASPVFVLREIGRATEDRGVLHERNLIVYNANESSDAHQQVLNDEILIFGYTVLLALLEVASHFLIAWSYSMNLRTACRLRSACLAVSYKKLLRSSLRCSTGAQQTLTYFVPDSESLLELLGIGPLILSGPAVLLCASAFAWFNVGSWALGALLLLPLLCSFLVITACFAKSFIARAISYSMSRMSLVEEFVNNMQLAKITLWDRHFQEKIKNVRLKEVSEMRMAGFCEGCGLSMVHIIPMLTIAAISIIGLQFGVQTPFAQYAPVMVLFLINLKNCIRTSWTALSGISKGLAFLNKLKSVFILPKADRFVEKPIDKTLAIAIQSGNFTWSNVDAEDEKKSKRTSRFYVDGFEGGTSTMQSKYPIWPVTSLTGIDFYVHKGKLVGVFGEQDSGKTSLLLSLLGQLRRLGGHVAIDGSFSYVPAVPWLLHGSLRDNVLFAENFDSNRYRRALRVSGLQNEITALAELDDTELRPRELLQTQPRLCHKVGLARAIYAQRDICLLDEPLGCLELVERVQLFEQCLRQLLVSDDEDRPQHRHRSRSVVVASDRPELLSCCDLIYVMREGKIVENGTHEQLVQSNNEYRARLLLSTRSNETMIQRHTSYRNASLPSPSSPRLLTPLSTRDFLSSTTTSFASVDDDNNVSQSLNSDLPILHKLLEGGEPNTGLGIYLRYTGASSVCVLICLLSSLCALSIALAPVFILRVELKVDKGSETAGAVLATLVGFTIVVGVVLTIAYNKTIFFTATNLHDFWIECLSSARISIFNTDTISLLLSICSLNLQEVDSVLPRSIIIVLINIGISFFSLAILWFLSPWFVLPVLGFILISIMLSLYVRRTVLSLHELKVSSATLVLSHVGNTVEGRAVILAYSKEKEFAKKYYKLFNENSTYDFMLNATRLWLEFRLKLLSALVISAVIFMSELLYNSSSGLANFSLAYICTFQLILSVLYVISAVNNTYTSLMALNSIDHYMKTVPKEREGSARIPVTWPVRGSVIFQNVTLSYKEGLLKKPITYCFAAEEPTAVISLRPETKMTFVSAIFRFIELPLGEIIIDGVSISQVPLKMLRQSLCFIPHDPPLFSGTIRYNLDPEEKMSDQAIMKILQKVNLWGKVSRLPNKLVSDSCHLFTVHEKILIFLARALLNERTKIIILNEPELDGLDNGGETVDTVLRIVFVNHTVIRLSSHMIRSCTKNLYLDDEVDGNNSDRGSSTLSHQTGTADIYTALPANILPHFCNINTH
ncbi:hypothetical protein QAD02_008804 [Eretmocerus hayati]|uniref:Uncharacterized protein n=1 Tax=Eretmocerus hayati TaxID=131215 RepID=A0ACC2N7K7_9HYME|nr:hypothetical protein QAD02_008804 [Eretmocerus hayati]